MLSKILGIFGNYGRAAAALALLSSIIALVSYVDTGGYNRAVQEYTKKSIEASRIASEEFVKQSSKDMQEALDKQSTLHSYELEFLKDQINSDVIRVEVIEYVEKIKIIDSCRVVGSDIIELLNQTVTRSNSETLSDSEAGSKSSRVPDNSVQTVVGLQE